MFLQYISSSKLGFINSSLRKINITSIRYFYITYQWKSHNKPRRSGADIYSFNVCFRTRTINSWTQLSRLLSSLITAATYIKYTSISYIFILLSPVFAITVNIDIKNCNKLMLLQFSFIIRTTYPLTYGNKLFLMNFININIK